MTAVPPVSSTRLETRPGRRVKARALALIRLIVVILAHGAALAAFLASPTTAPQLPAQTIEVSLVEPGPAIEPAPPPSPQPVAKPQVPTPPPEPVVKRLPEPVEKPRSEPIAKSRPKPVVKPAPRPTPKPPRPQETAISPPPQPVTEPAAPTAQASATTTTTSSKSAAKASEHSAAQRGTPSPVSRARFDAAYLNNPRPSYPRVSRRTNEQGRVLLRVHVEASGAPSAVQLHKSSGYLRLDKAAREAVKRWRFEPAKRGSAAIASWIIVPIDFKLEGS